MGVGRGKGENKLEDAVSGAINSPLLETKISGARAVLINITGGRDLTMFDVDKVASRIDEEADDNAIIILGASIKEEMQDEISVTVIAAGFEKSSSVDILNSPVIPSAPVENTAAAEPAGGGSQPFHLLHPGAYGQYGDRFSSGRNPHHGTDQGCGADH